jgi:hypothetical protein
VILTACRASSSSAGLALRTAHHELARGDEGEFHPNRVGTSGRHPDFLEEVKREHLLLADPQNTAHSPGSLFVAPRRSQLSNFSFLLDLAPHPETPGLKCASFENCKALFFSSSTSSVLIKISK